MVPQLEGRARLTPVSFAEFPGFAADDHALALETFLVSCRRMAAAPLDPSSVGDALATALRRVCTAAQETPIDAQSARSFFERNFQPVRIEPVREGAPEAGFVTGYYEPVIEASETRTDAFSEPALARPDDLVTTTFTVAGEVYTAGRVTAGGDLQPYPSRAEIEADPAYRPIAWLRDGIELFMVQVQGSARVKFADGRTARLRYAGKNGHPYTSIGKLLNERGEIPLAEMSLDSLKAWVRKAGQGPGERGRALLHENRSYVFFDLAHDASDQGPLGGEGVPLTPLRSLAVDRSIWPYGLPVWIEGRVPDETGSDAPFARLMVAQDTGSAIVGPARGDIYVGSGDAAGRRAGLIRHRIGFTVLLPRPE
ncbi:MAG TPA: MltA domain-containing protein [Beijerinckiaceae bacterium]|jgi:membrane-bound lytic murein transglycosylase A